MAQAKIAVAGATGRLGRHVAGVLGAAGHQVVPISRSAGVARYVVVSIIGIGRSAGGYGAAKLAHEQAVLAGPVPAAILRVAQFHELVGVLMDMGRQGEVIYLPQMRTQIIAARTVAAALAAIATSPPAEFAAARAAQAAGAPVMQKMILDAV